jgi:hypothetical protein
VLLGTVGVVEVVAEDVVDDEVSDDVEVDEALMLLVVDEEPAVVDETELEDTVLAVLVVDVLDEVVGGVVAGDVVVLRVVADVVALVVLRVRVIDEDVTLGEAVVDEVGVVAREVVAVDVCDVVGVVDWQPRSPPEWCASIALSNAAIVAKHVSWSAAVNIPTVHPVVTSSTEDPGPVISASTASSDVAAVPHVAPSTALPPR